MRSRCRCSMCPAIHINSRSWLRSSSTHEPSDPPLRVVLLFHRSACRGNSEHTSTVGVRSVSAASFQSWTFELVTSDMERVVHRGAARMRLFEPSQERPFDGSVLLTSPFYRETQVPHDADETCIVWDSGAAPRRSPPAGEVPFFRTNDD